MSPHLQFLPKLHHYYTIVNSSFEQKSELVQYGICGLFIIPLLLIVLLQILIVYIIPVNITLQYIFLNLTQPNPANMFLSNYMHNPALTSHLTNNYLSYLFCMGTVIILYYVVIPLGKYKNKLILKYPDSSFFATNLAILLLFPYAESGLSILFGRWMGITGEAGFSGIVYAILAYILFLFLKIGYDLILTKQQQRSQPLGDPIVILIFVAIVAIIAPIYAIFLEMGNHQVNIFGHFAGYSLGLVISASMAIIYETDEERLKIFSLSVLGISLLFSTLCWLIIT